MSRNILDYSLEELFNLEKTDIIRLILEEQDARERRRDRARATARATARRKAQDMELKTLRKLGSVLKTPRPKN